jgi:hypothetical protein
MTRRIRNWWQVPSSTGLLVLSTEETKRISYYASHLFLNLRLAKVSFGRSLELGACYP